MSLQIQPGVIEQRHGRGSNRKVLLLRDGKWLARIRWAPTHKLWVISRGGHLALDKIVASAHDFEEARELAHKMVLLKATRKCIACAKNLADPPSSLCPGCEAYREHQQ
jgi:hypothetical protein